MNLKRAGNNNHNDGTNHSHGSMSNMIDPTSVRGLKRLVVKVQWFGVKGAKGFRAWTLEDGRCYVNRHCTPT